MGLLLQKCYVACVFAFSCGVLKSLTPGVVHLTQCWWESARLEVKMTYNHQRPAAHSKSGVPPGSSARVGIIAWAFYDWANSAFPTVVLTFVFASYFTRHVAPNEALGSALWGNTVAAAEISVAVVGPMLGAIADQTGRNKLWIAAFTLLCAASAGLLWFVNPSPQSVWLALVLVGRELNRPLSFWINPDCGFNPTPRWIALPKLKAMVEVTKIVQRELGQEG
jgi:hypothetical protein